MGAPALEIPITRNVVPFAFFDVKNSKYLMRKHAWGDGRSAGAAALVMQTMGVMSGSGTKIRPPHPVLSQDEEQGKSTKKCAESGWTMNNADVKPFMKFRS